MPDASITVHQESLRAGGAGLGSSAESLRQAWASFNAQVAAMGDIFGDDSVGGLIGVSYQAAHSIAEQSFASVADAFDGFAVGLSAAADQYQAIEAEIVAHLHGVLG